MFINIPNMMWEIYKMRIFYFISLNHNTSDLPKVTRQCVLDHKKRQMDIQCIIYIIY